MFLHYDLHSPLTESRCLSTSVAPLDHPHACPTCSKCWHALRISHVAAYAQCLLPPSGALGMFFFTFLSSWLSSLQYNFVCWSHDQPPGVSPSSLSLFSTQHGLIPSTSTTSVGISAILIDIFTLYHTMTLTTCSSHLNQYHTYIHICMDISTLGVAILVHCTECCNEMHRAIEQRGCVAMKHIEQSWMQVDALCCNGGQIVARCRWAWGVLQQIR